MIKRKDMIYLLKQWGCWQRTAQEQQLGYSISQMDSPLPKVRAVRPIFKDEQSEHLDFLMVKYLSNDFIECLQLEYVEQAINDVSATTIGKNVKHFRARRNEAIAALSGIYAVSEDR